jgi:DNA-damage-inducible protein J
MLNRRRILMHPSDTYVRARIDIKTKQRAATALEAMGLSVSGAIRLLLLRVADERRLPFDIKAPSQSTRKAIAELSKGHSKQFKNVKALMKDLHEDD